MWKYLIALALVGHGFAHMTGVLAAWAGVDVGFSKKTWLLSNNVTMADPIGRVFGFIWLAAMLGLLAAAVLLVVGRGQFYPVATAAAILSLAAIVPWWNTVVPGARVGAIFDMLLLVAICLPWRQMVFQVAP